MFPNPVIKKYELRYNDGIVNTHPSVIKEVILMQQNLKANHCFSDLIANGRYDDMTLKAMLLMKRRLQIAINDRCNLSLWSYFLDGEDIQIIPKPLQGLALPENIEKLITIPFIELENILAKLIAIPNLISLDQSKIGVLMALSFYLGFDYGKPDFDALNTGLSLGCFDDIPQILKLYQNPQNKPLIEHLINKWNNKT